MKPKLTNLFIGVILIFTSLTQVFSNPKFMWWRKNKEFGIGNEFMFEGKEKFGMGKEIGGFGKMGIRFYLDYLNLQPIFEKYRVKIEKIFLDSKESKIELENKARELGRKLIELSSKYKDDKQVAKEIQEVVKNLNEIGDKIQNINKEAMDKIRLLNEEREKEIKKIINDWINKLSTDSKEMDKFTDFINRRCQKIK